MVIDVKIKDEMACLAIRGRFDFQLHREFKDAYTKLLENPATHGIELDMSRIEYIDSSALGMLMLLNERSKAAGKSVALVNPSTPVAQVLDVANFGKIFNIKRTS